MVGSYMLLHAEHTSHSGLAHWLTERLGSVGCFIDEVILHGVADTLKLVLFLFFTYLLMEFIEHKASDRVKGTMTRAGSLGPLIGGTFGAIPQCGFSAAAANLYTGRVITLGTLVAVFLSTSDEMLPILIAGNMDIGKALLIMAYKCAVGIAVGFGIDIFLRVMHKEREAINIDEICDNDDCHCENGILGSALHHTASVSFFVLAVTLVVNMLVFFVGDEALSGSIVSVPVIGHVISSIVGLIPNCASSVALTRLAMSGVISTGAMISGLCSGAGVGLLILFKMNHHRRENLIITAILVVSGVIFGLLADAIGISIL